MKIAQPPVHTPPRTRSRHDHLRHRHPPDRRAVGLRRRRRARLPAPRRGARLRQRLDPGAGARRPARPRPAGGAGLRRGVHRADPPRLRRAGQLAGQPTAPGQEHRHGRPAERRPARDRARHRRRLPRVRGVRRRPGVVRRPVQRGPGADAPAVDRRAGRPRRPVLAARRRGDGAEAGAAAGPPIWFGGAHPAALRRAVAHADGFIGAGSQTTARFVEQVGASAPRSPRPGATRRRSASPSAST